MRSRMGSARCCCGPTPPVTVYPSGALEFGKRVFFTSTRDAYEGSTEGAMYRTVFGFGAGFFYTVPLAVPASVTTLVMQLRTKGIDFSPVLFPTPSIWEDTQFELVLVPRDWIPTGATYDFDTPHTIATTWNVTGAWLPSITAETPDVSGIYNTLMAAPIGPYPLLGTAGRIVLIIRAITNTTVGEDYWTRAMDTVAFPGGPTANRFLYSS